MGVIFAKDVMHMIPHRPPMFWIDEIHEYSSAGGVCKVKVQEDAHYMSAAGLRSSSLIEFIAQAQALVGICALKDSGQSNALKATYLVSVTDFQIPDAQQLNVKSGEVLSVEVKSGRNLGPIMLFSGQIKKSDGSLIGSASLKAFAAVES